MNSQVGALPKVVVIGAGPAGSLLAILLARRGYRVDVYERRADPRSGAHGEGRSINLGLSARGIEALRRAGLWADARALSVPMRGRVVHRPAGEPLFQPYGRGPGEILHSVRRDALSALIVDRAEKHPGVRFFFGARCTAVDRDRAVVTVTGEDGTESDGTESGGAERAVEADFVVGADGAFSLVRSEIHRGLPADFRQEFLEWGYKELTLPTAPGGRVEALHVWPGRQGLIVGHPNLDNSVTCTLFLPHERFAELGTAQAVRAMFGEHFPGVLAMVPDLAAQFAAAPVGHLVSVRASPWHHRGEVVLVGDSCHAVYPFYGQGLNSSLEDCVVLDECLAGHRGDRAAAFAEYQRRRKPHTDVLAELSAANFVELRDRLRSPLHLARKKADLVLQRLFPDAWVPLYTMVSHTTMPYGEALRRSRRQERTALVVAAAALLSGVIVSALWRRRAGQA